MEAYLIWFVIAIVLVILEIVTAGFGAICFAIGAVASGVTALLGGGFLWQISIFIVVSLLTFIFLRPVILKFFDKRSKNTKTNAEALVGRTALVSETIDPVAHTGRVAIDGDDWKAVSEGGVLIEKGKEVVVVDIDSIVLTVKIK